MFLGETHIPELYDIVWLSVIYSERCGENSWEMLLKCLYISKGINTQLNYAFYENDVKGLIELKYPDLYKWDGLRVY